MIDIDLLKCANLINKYISYGASLDVFINLQSVDYSYILDYKSYFFSNDSLYYRCIQINNNYYKKYKRLRSRISTMLMLGQCYFLTLTFSDDVLSRYSSISRRNRVVDFLRFNYRDYVANIDYGDLNGREHYHAVCLFNNDVDFSTWYNRYYKCIINCEPIYYNNYLTSNTEIACSKYLYKIVNHAVKNSTKRNNIIYCKSPLIYLKGRKLC